MRDVTKVKFVGRGILFALGALVFAALLALVMGWVLMLLWNWLMPEVFGLPLIGYWQAWGLILLSHLLFKGGHGGPGRHPHFRAAGPGRRGAGHRGAGRGRHFHNNEDLDEFKDEFKRRMKARWHDESGEEPSEGSAKDREDSE